MSGRTTRPALFFLSFIAFLLAAYTAGGQCCSTGSPVGASVYVGVLGRNYLRAIAYYRHSYSDTYYEGNKSTTDNVQLSSASFNFSGLAVEYGITKRLTIGLDAGYYFDKTQVFKHIDYTAKGYGLSNGTLTVKYGDYINPAKQVELTTGLGFRFPFTFTPQSVDGVQLNRDVQPSTNAFGLSEIIFFNKGFQQITLRVFTINRYDYNFEDRSGYKYGSILLNSVFVSKKLFKYCFGLVQVRNEWKTNDKDYSTPNENGGNEVINSGYDLITVSPQLSYSIAGKWNLTAIYDIPVYKYYNGRQMTPKYSFAISLTRDFNLGRKQPVIQPEKIN